jgi:hypothetical protein
MAKYTGCTSIPLQQQYTTLVMVKACKNYNTGLLLKPCSCKYLEVVNSLQM